MKGEEREERQPARIWEADVSVSIFLGVCLDPDQPVPTVKEILTAILDNHPYVDAFQIETSGTPEVRDYSKPKNEREKNM